MRGGDYTKAEIRKQRAKSRNPAAGTPTAGFLLSALCFCFASLRPPLRIKLVSLLHAVRSDARAELFAEARLEPLDSCLVGAGEDADELAAAVVANDVL